MKVLLVNGSPNEKGCTYTALQEVARTLEKEGIETEFFWIGKKAVSGCIACHKCREIGCCVFKDVVNEFREKALTADGFIFGSPVHYASLAGNMASFMDRVFYSELNGNDNKAFYLKPAAAVISARRAGTTVSFDQMNKYFTLQEMPVISSRYWNEVHGAVPSEVLEDKEGMYTMRVLGRNMAYFLRCREAARKAGVALPEREEAIFTNFIH
ncbi:flavodoxin family protein [uncultured Megasphaera sp.]|uniref:flavodoxin family protein n=1 Tax=uncultured Megasphaera sp. TaxID=165188 RepID=UPI00259440D5|nr:flavodoxin family protein [uncultured Megasphaera sp.]